ncbi:hypothetical protein ACIOD1_33100 [Streptomyces sp. NPDC088097]|uniref:hypothetical protein n=1 Tax=Streptomyces sp. NPDC088097 TaxID=3365823 RepID=UPI0037F78D13
MSYPTGNGPADLPDGNYPNTKSKYSYYVVSGGYARLVDCANCDVNPDNCPDGKLTFDLGERVPLWSYEADTSYLES